MTRIEFAIRAERCWFRACRHLRTLIRTITGDNR